MNDPNETIDRSLASQSDADLLGAWVRDQEQAAFAALVRRYSTMVLSVCRRRCHNANDADDAYQTTFLYFARKAGTIRRPDCLAGWLHRVAQRASMATITKNKHSQDALPDVPAKTDDPLDRLTQRHQAIVLDEELAALPEHYRAALVLHVYEGKTLAAMAEHFQTTIGSVRGRLQRGKQMLAQKLRRRGIVPVVALAAASSWTATASAAANSAHKMVDLTSGGSLPEPAISPRQLETHLANDTSFFSGAHTMTSTYTAASLFGGTAIVLMMLASDNGHPPHRGSTTGQIVQLTTATDEQPSSIPTKLETTSDLLAQVGEKATKQANDELAESPAGENLGEQPAAPDQVAQQANHDPPAPQMMKVPQLVQPSTSSEVALQAKVAMDKQIDVSFAISAAELETKLSAILNIPVFVDRRAVKHAELPSNAVFKLDSDNIPTPTRTALRRLLRPHGLKATIENEGIVITADHAELARRGIGVNSWISLSNELEQEVSEKLNQKYDMKFKEMPLVEVVDAMSEVSGIPMRLDVRSLEEIGVSADTMVSLDATKITMKSALRVIGRVLDLQHSIQGEEVVISTPECWDQNMLARVYWIEGTGFSGEDFSSLMSVIETSLDTDMWEALGGPCTMTPVAAKRPGIAISAPYPLHKKIESFFKTMRESNFGPDPVIEYVDVPAQPAQGGGGFGGGGGGLGGGGLGGGQGGGGFF